METYVLVLQRFEDRRVTASACYLDRFEKRAGEWRVAPMREPLRFPPGFTEQKHGMDDPLYQLKARPKP